MGQRDAKLNQGVICEIEECDETSTFTVARGERELSVCRRCVQEMVVLFDWTLIATPMGEVAPADREPVGV